MRRHCPCRELHPSAEFALRRAKGRLNCRFCINITDRLAKAVHKGQLCAPHGQGLRLLRSVYRGEVQWDDPTRAVLLRYPEEVIAFDRILVANAPKPENLSCPHCAKQIASHCPTASQLQQGGASDNVLDNNAALLDNANAPVARGPAMSDSTRHGAEILWAALAGGSGVPTDAAPRTNHPAGTVGHNPCEGTTGAATAQTHPPPSPDVLHAAAAMVELAATGGVKMSAAQRSTAVKATVEVPATVKTEEVGKAEEENEDDGMHKCSVCGYDTFPVTQLRIFLGISPSILAVHASSSFKRACSIW